MCSGFSCSQFYFKVTGSLLKLEGKKNTLSAPTLTHFSRVVCKKKNIFSFLMSKSKENANAYFTQNWGGGATSQLHLKFLKLYNTLRVVLRFLGGRGGRVGSTEAVVGFSNFSFVFVFASL